MDKTNKIFLDEKGYELFLKNVEHTENKLLNHQKANSESYTSNSGNGWHDNFEFEEHTRVEKLLKSQLSEKKEQLKNIVIIQDNTTDKDFITINDFVTLKIIYNDKDFEVETFQLVSYLATSENTDNRFISLNCPIGKAIYNKKIGSVTEYKIKNKIIKVKILKKNIQEI